MCVLERDKISYIHVYIFKWNFVIYHLHFFITQHSIYVLSLVHMHSVAQFCVRLFVTQRPAAHQASLSITNSQSLLKLMSIASWCQPTISSPVVPFSCHLQSFPASGSFPMSQFFTSGGQSIRVSAPESVLPINIQDWFPLGWMGWISLQSKGLSRVFSNITVQSFNSQVLSFLYSPTLTSIYDYWKSNSFD